MICQALRPFLRTSLKMCDLNEIDLFDTGRREQRGRSNILEEASVWSPPPELRPHRFNSGILPSLRFDQAAKQIYQDSLRCLFDPQRPRRTYCLQRRPTAIQAHINPSNTILQMSFNTELQPYCLNLLSKVLNLVKHIILNTAFPSIL